MKTDAYTTNKALWVTNYISEALGEVMDVVRAYPVPAVYWGLGDMLNDEDYDPEDFAVQYLPEEGVVYYDPEHFLVTTEVRQRIKGICLEMNVACVDIYE